MKNKQTFCSRFSRIWRESFILMVLLGLIVPHAAWAYKAQQLSLEAWARPLQGEEVLQSAALQSIIQQWQAESAKIIIRYPGGEMGEFWALQLRDWLVALGVPLDEVELSPGSVTPENLDVLVIPVQEKAF